MPVWSRHHTWIQPFRAYPRLHERPPSRLFLRSLGAPCPGTRTLRWVIASGWANPPSPVTWVQLAHAKTPDGCRAPPSSTSHCTTWLWHCASRMAHLCVGGPRLDDPFRAPAMSMTRENPRIAHRYTLPVAHSFLGDPDAREKIECVIGQRLSEHGSELVVLSAGVDRHGAPWRNS